MVPAKTLVVLLALLLIISSCHAGSRSTPTDPLFPFLFISSPSILTGEQPRDAALLDVDDDRNLDLVTSNSKDGTISLFLGVGDGTFVTPAVDFVVAGEPRALATADFNRDRLPDVAVTLFSANAVAIFLNDALGGFLSPLIVEVGANPIDIEVADFDRDGFLDLVTANRGNGTLSIAAGAGNGAFGAASHLAVVGNPVSVSVGDLDIDDLLDIAVASTDAGVVSVLHGDGTGFFPREQTFSEVTSPSAVLFEEVNGDRADDLVVTDDVANTVTVLANDAMGSASATLTFDVGANPVAIALAQLAGDDLFDLVVASKDDSTISILEGKKQGAFLSFEEPFSMPVGKSPVAIIAADVDRDRDTDLFVVAEESSAVSILQSRFDEDGARQGPLPSGDGASSVAVGDFNGDGATDAVTSNNLGDSLTVHEGVGDGTFITRKEISVGDEPRAIESRDFDVDGFVDVVFVLSAMGEDKLVILHGGPDFDFDRRLEYDTGREPRDLLLADFNRDLAIDVAVLNGRSPAGVSVFLGDGGGELMPFPDGDFGVATGPQALDSGDFNRDLIPDLFVAGTNTNSVSVHFGAGDGSFTSGPVVSTATDTAPRGLETGDFNGDAFLDVVVTLSMSGQVAVLFGDGDGDFLRDGNDPNIVLGLTLDLFGQPRAVRASDLNADGRLDLAVGLFGRSAVALLIGDGVTLSPGEGIDVGRGPSDIAFADFDQNGQRDVVTANSGDGTISFVLHRDRQ